MRDGGESLPESALAFFEPRFGYDFSRVQVHTDTRAGELARALNARAYTVGRNVVFGAGQYAPETQSGRRLLSHELTHVVQQNNNANFKKEHVIQRWDAAGHRNLTEKGIKKIFLDDKGLKKDKEALNSIADYSSNMDYKKDEIEFNWKGLKIITKAKPEPPPPLGSPYQRTEEEKRKVKIYLIKKLINHYKQNQDNARNHGEGGLYYMSERKAAAENVAQQMHYELDAWRAFQKLSQVFPSWEKCKQVKSTVRENVFKVLGDALHIAQDRGAHGEGARLSGHALEIWTDGKFEPDNESVNSKGYEKALRNTELLLVRAFEILNKLLDIKYLKVCTFPIEEHIIAPKIIASTEKQAPVITYEPRSFSHSSSLAQDMRIASIISDTSDTSKTPIAFLGNPEIKESPHGLKNINLESSNFIDIEELRKGMKIFLGVTFLKPYRAFERPNFETEIITKRTEGNKTKYYVKVKKTRSKEPTHKSYYVGEGYHLIAELSKPPIWQLQRKKRQTTALSIYVFISHAQSELSKKAEQEHIDDAHQAFVISYKEFEKHINLLAERSEKKPIGPWDSDTKAKKAAEDELMQMLPEKMRYKSKNWPELLKFLLELTKIRDFLGWHNVISSSHITDEFGNVIFSPKIPNKEKIGTISSKELVNYDWLDKWGYMAVKVMKEEMVKK